MEVRKHLYFDKSRLLSGYPVTIADFDVFYDYTLKSPIKFRLYSARVLEEIFSQLQSTINIKIVPEGSFAMNENGTYVGSSLLKIFNGTFDTRVIFRKFSVFSENFGEMSLIYILEPEFVTY